ncbi:MAG: AsmA family protein [Gammaproteobacteria bacterium]|nr:AsmA family protein [Gammaproteobacteria bacterium]MBU1481427.1 AsmA family protein [Gammaproteobacteria bacterium]
MNKYLKYGLWSIGIMAIVFAGVIAFIALTFNPNDYKPQIIQTVKDSKQRTLKLDGNIALHFFPSIGVSLGRISLSEFQSDKEFVSVERASVSLKLLPLLFRQIVVDEVAVSGAKAQLIKYRNGNTNLDDLLGKEAAPAASAPVAEAAAAAPMMFDIASVRLDKTELSYSDEITGARYDVHNLMLQTGRIANGLPARMDFAAHIQSNKPKLDIAAQIKTTLTLELEKNRYRVQGLDLQANGAALGMTSLAVKASGDAGAHPALREFSLNNFAFTASGVKGKDRFETRLDVPDLNLTRDKFTGNHIVLNAKLDGQFGNVAALFSLDAITGSARVFKIGSLELNADLKQPEQSFKMKLSSPVTGSIDAQQFNLSGIRLALNATGDKLPNKSIDSELRGKAQADLGRQNVEASLAGGLLQSQIKATVAVKNFNVPLLRYDVEIDKFDADPFLPKQTPEAAEKAGGGKAESGQPFDLSALKTLNLKGRLRIGSLKVANVKVAQLRVGVRANKGQIEIDPLSAKMYKGSVDGKASLNASTYDFTVNEKLTGIDIAPLLKDAANLELIEGRGNIALDLNARGNSVSGLKKALNGKTKIDLTNGALKGINLPKLVQGVQSLNKDSKMETLGMDKNEKTPFSTFKATFKIRNGVAHNDDLAVKSTVLRMTGKGDINIGRDSMNYNAKAIFAKTEHGKTGTLPVNVSGPFDDLKFKVDYTALLRDVAKQKLDEKKEKLREDAKAKAREELKKSLKGLFK